MGEYPSKISKKGKIMLCGSPPVYNAVYPYKAPRAPPRVWPPRASQGVAMREHGKGQRGSYLHASFLDRSIPLLCGSNRRWLGQLLRSHNRSSGRLSPFRTQLCSQQTVHWPPYRRKGFLVHLQPHRRPHQLRGTFPRTLPQRHPPATSGGKGQSWLGSGIDC